MSVSKQYLSIHDHSRELSGLKYIYSVISRRAGGLSIGVNLNVNNACNWQCIYCEIPNLTRGSPPPIELDVLEGIEVLAKMNGEVWFKVDAGLEESAKVINQVNIKPQQAIDRLKRCSEICPTFVQTCIFTIDNKEPNNKEIDAYIKLIDSAKKSIKGVHLYGIARPSMQPEAYRLGRVNINVLENIADQLHNNGIESTVSY